MIRALLEKIDKMQEHVVNVSKEIKILRKKIKKKC